MPKPTGTLGVVFLLVTSCCSPLWARQGPPPDYGFDFVTIGAPGNPVYNGPDPIGLLQGGRGSVPYLYRIARTEVTTGQWLEFVNTFTMRQDPETGLNFLPSYWGAHRDFGYTGPGYRWVLRTDIPNATMLPVLGFNWREAAMYCNWLNNARSADPSSLLSGAYDASTFGRNPDGTFTDQATRSPGARFFIPTLDEWIKAAHYDPNRYGPGQGGYWLYSHRSDDFPVAGVPGTGQTSAGLDVFDPATFDIALRAYPDVQSPWGLWDTSGGAMEWTEEIRGRRWRIADGHNAGSLDPSRYPYPFYDQIAFAQALDPEESVVYGLRVASVVPSPGGALIVVSLALWTLRTMRGYCNRVPDSSS